MEIKEYRIFLLVIVDEYKIGQLYVVVEVSKNEIGGGEGIEVVLNELYVDYVKYFDGQYIYKIFYLKFKVLVFVCLLVLRGFLEVYEKVWNVYLYCRMEYLNLYMKDIFFFFIDIWYKEGEGLDNVYNLIGDELWMREVVNIDIIDFVFVNDYKEDEDLCKFYFEKIGWGFLVKNVWKMNKDYFKMICYKLYRVKFKWWGFQMKVQNVIFCVVL